MNKLAVVTWLALLAGTPVFAMDALDDAALSELSGQDGMKIDLRLPNSTLMLSQASLKDSGISGTHLGQSFASLASMAYAPTTYSATAGGISLCTTVSGACTAETSPISLRIDAGSAAATSTLSTLNFGLDFPTTTRRLLLNPFSLYMSPAGGSIFNAGRTALNANVNEIVRVTGAEGLSILLAAPAVGTPVVGFNLQLGNEAQGHMIAITSGKLLRIGNDPSGANPIQILSKNSSVVASSLKVNFDLCSTDAVNAATGACNTAYSGTGGFSLTGFYGDFTSNSFVFGHDTTTDKLNIVFDNAVAGTLGSQAATSFDNLKNGSMGSIGLVGVQVTNLRMTVQGM